MVVGHWVLMESGRYIGTIHTNISPPHDMKWTWPSGTPQQREVQLCFLQ